MQANGDRMAFLRTDVMSVIDNPALLLSASRQFDSGVLVNHTAPAEKLQFKQRGSIPMKPTFTLLQISFAVTKVLACLL
jgi:hypothetical protein